MYSYLTVNEPSHREIGIVCRFSLQRNVARPYPHLIFDGLIDYHKRMCSYLSISVMWQTRTDAPNESTVVYNLKDLDPQGSMISYCEPFGSRASRNILLSAGRLCKSFGRTTSLVA
jgi:hypothetical protein